MRTTDKEFGEAVKELLNDREWSLRELQRRTQDQTEWGSLSTIHLLLAGQLKPSPQAIERIAGVLRVDPEYFAEYRLWQLRHALDPERVGLSEALAVLESLDGKH
jgi:transcriptional regulator with XRE-family HTH domain